MKWLRCDGRELVVRDVSEPLARYVPAVTGAALKHVDELMTEDAARAYLRELLDSGAAVKSRV